MKKIFLLVEAGIIVFIVTTLLTLTWVINIHLVDYIDTVKDDLIADFKEQTGFSIEYQSISPNIIGRILVYEVILKNVDGARFELGDIELGYSLTGLLTRPKRPVSLIKNIKLKRLRVDIEREYIIEQVSNMRNRVNRGSLLDQISDMTVEIPRGKVVVKDGDRSYRLATENVKLVLRDDITVNGLLLLTLFMDDVERASSRIRIDGTVSRKSEPVRSDIDFEVQQAAIGSTLLKPQRFRVMSDGDDFSIERYKDSLPVDFTLARVAGQYIADISIEDLDVHDILISGKKNTVVPDSLTLQSDMAVDLDDGTVTGSYSSSVSWDQLAFLNNFSVETDLSFNGKKIAIDLFKIYNEDRDGAISIEGDIPLDASDFSVVLNSKDFKLPGTQLNTIINLTREKRNTRLFNDYLLVNGTDIGQIDIRLQKSGNRWLLFSERDFNGYSIDGSISNRGDDYVARISHRFERFSISRIIGAYNSDHKDDITLNGTLSNLFSRKQRTVQKSNFTILNRTEKKVSFSLGLLNNFLSVDDVVMYGGRQPLRFDGWVDFRKQPVVAFARMDRETKDLTLVTTILKEKVVFALNRELFAGYVYNSGKAYVSARNFRIPVGDGQEIGLSCNFQYDSRKRRIKPSRITLKDLGIFQGQKGNLTAVLSVRENKLTIDDVVYRDDENLIKGELIQNMNLGKTLEIDANGFFQDDEKGESYSLSYSLAGDQIDAKLYVTHLEASKLLARNINGFLNLRLNLYGSLPDPNYDLDLDITEGSLSGNDLAGFLVIKKIDNTVTVKKANIQLGQSRIFLKDSQVKQLPSGNSEVYFSGDLSVERLSKIVRADVLVTGSYDSLLRSSSPMEFDISVTNLTLGILRGNSLDSVEKYPDRKFNLNRKNGVLVFKNYGEKLVYVTIEENRMVTKLYNRGHTILDGVIDTTTEGDLSADLILDKFPVTAARLIVTPFVGLDAGLIDGNVRLTNTIGKPEYGGKLKLYSAEVSLPEYLPDPVKDISGVVIADKNKIVVNSVNGSVRRGLVNGYGEMIFNGWKFERFLFRLTTDTIPGLVDKGPIEARGTGRVEEFIFEGRPRNFTFIGNIFVDTADVNLANFFSGGKKSKPKTIPLNVILNFTAGRKVKASYPIISGTVKPGSQLTFKYFGSEPQIYLGGQVELKGGEVNYLDKQFKIEQAQFTFFEDETRIDPAINLKSYFRTRDTKGNSTKVYLTVADRLLSFKTQFSAFPFKSPEEINSLLGLSLATNTESSFADLVVQNPLTEEESEQEGQNIDTIVNTTNYISNSFIFSPIENRIKQITSLDTFTMNTKFFGNIISSNLYDESSNLLDLLDESSITLGKYLFSQLYLESMMSLNKKSSNTFENDYLFLPFPDQNYGLNLSMMLQLELQNFSVAYTYLPRNYQNIADADHNVSLEANFKF
jgi:hypothetical protein